MLFVSRSLLERYGRQSLKGQKRIYSKIVSLVEYPLVLHRYYLFCISVFTPKKERRKNKGKKRHT